MSQSAENDAASLAETAMRAAAEAIRSRDGRVDAGWLLTTGVRAATAALLGVPLWCGEHGEPFCPRHVLPPVKKVRIYKDAQGDWIAEDECDYCVCSDWYAAMEWAYGHLAMGHDKEKT